MPIITSDQFAAMYGSEADALRIASLRLLRKFHRETDCGRDGDHWVECELMVDALGLDDDRHEAVLAELEAYRHEEEA